jgi:hypothetical protein
MPDYRWTCHACSSVNEAGNNVCSECGCSATASAEEIDLHSSPGAYKKKKAIEKVQKAIMVLIVIPFFAVKFAMHGSIEMLLLLMVSIGVAYKSNSELLTHIWKSKWASNTLLLWSGSTIILILLRVTVVENDSSLIGYLAAVLVLIHISMIWYLFKSKRGVQFFSDYYEKANQ